MQCSELEILNMLPKVLAYAITKKPSNCEFFLDLWSEIERKHQDYYFISWAQNQLKINSKVEFKFDQQNGPRGLLKQFKVSK